MKNLQERYLNKRRESIQVILLILIPLLGTLAYLRSREPGNQVQMQIDLVLMTIALTGLILLRRFPSLYQVLIKFFLFSAFFAFLATLYLQRGDPRSLIWGITVVLLAFLLSGRHTGWLLTLATITGTLGLVLLSPAYLSGLDALSLLIFIGNALLVAIFASLYEYISEEEYKQIRYEQNRLESLVRFRTRSLHEANVKAQKALKAAQEASEAKSTFLANVSHEIRTPLNAISGFITMMLKDETDPQKRKQLQTINEASEILTQLISDILDLSKIESGNMELHFKDFDPRQLFFSIAELYQSRAQEKEIDLSIEFCRDGEETHLLHSDPVRIRQVLSNLLSNAVKFTPRGGKVLVGACYRDGWLSISVKDNGIGMSPADQERIFQPFQQASGRDSNIQGTGLGLTISREIAEKLKGRLEVRSSPGLGSTFTFSFPARKVNKARIAAEETPLRPRKVPEHIDAHLLIVEDVRANQMFLTMVLDRHGISYEIANDGVEAVDLYRINRYDLILMDENMPRMSGIQATQEIRQIEKEEGREPVPIIALTANAVAGDRERILKAGMDEYISKPVNPDKLIRTIATLLNKWS